MKNPFCRTVASHRNVNMKRRVSRVKNPPRRNPLRDTPGTAVRSVNPFLRRVYQHHQSRVSKPVRRAIAFGVAAVLIYAFVLGDSGLVRILMLRSDHARVEAQIANLNASAGRLQAEIVRLRDDPQYIEKTGRERFGYVRADEKVYRIVDDVSPAPADKP